MQDRIFKELQSALGREASVSKWLSTVLDIDHSAAYRKVQGQTGLKLPELEKIMIARPETMRAIIPPPYQPHYFVGSYHSFRDETDIIAYFKRVLQAFQRAVKYSSPLKYFARDLPLVLFLAEREVLSYKLSVWTNQLSQNGLQTFGEDVYRIADDIFAVYQTLPTEEIWFWELMANQSAQLQWYQHIGAIGADQKTTIESQLSGILAGCREWAKKGMKGNGSYTLMSSRHSTMNNGGILLYPENPVLMTALSGVFFISTDKKELTESFLRQFEFHKRSATGLSKANTLERNHFFDHLEDSIFS